MKTLALFDFDGTLYEKDSLIEFTKFYKGKKHFYIGILSIFPYLLGMKLGIVSNEKTKKKYFSYFFKNSLYTEFKTKSKEFSSIKIDAHLNQKIYSNFINHLQLKDTVYIVTASFPEWVEPWSSQFGVQVIGTQIKVKDNVITGEFTSKNCFGIEKVNRINMVLNIDNFDTIKVYGFGKGDQEMLKLST